VKRLLILSEVYFPEIFIINELSQELSKEYQVTVLTRSPSYPQGKIFPGFKNTFSKTLENDTLVYRIPVFLNYKSSIFAKIANLLWQPLVYGCMVPFLKWDKLFVYQTGSLYTYTLLWPLRFTKRKTIIWSQDLWPEAGFEFGLPRVEFLETLLFSISKFTLSHFKKILVQSESFKNNYRRKYKIESEVVKNFSSVNKATDYCDRSNNTSIVYAGNIGSVQNLEGIISLFELLRESNVPINNLRIYGDGSKLESLLSKYGNRSDITFFGRVSRDKVEEELKNCRYAIFSLKEGPIQMTIPSRLQFLYNNNTPIIYLGEGASKELIVDTGCGVVIDSLDLGMNDIIQRFQDFELSEFNTPDIFNKVEIVEQIKNVIDKN
jgi:glycosyltransferase involved in cell wall biosynthesis